MDVRVVVGDEVVVELLGEVLEEVLRAVDVRVVVDDEVVVELLWEVLEEVEDTVRDREHPEALVLSVRTIVYPEALRSK